MAEPGDLRDGVFVIVRSLNSILLVRHNYGEGLWSLPGGGVKQGEVVIDAARRELREETSIEEVATLKQIGIFTLIKRYGLVVLFEAIGWDGYPTADSKEIAECGFFTLQDLGTNKAQIYPAQLKMISIFLKYGHREEPVYGKLTNPPIIELE